MKDGRFPGVIRLTWLSLAAAILLFACMYLAYRQEHRQIREQLLADQLSITQARAGRIENNFLHFGLLLHDLTLDIARLPREQLRARLPDLLARHSRPAIRALFLRDNQGNILASADPDQLASNGLPIHLLGVPTRAESGQRLVFTPDPCLLIGEYSSEPERQDLELVALASLPALLTEGATDPGEQTALVSADGRQLVPPPNGAETALPGLHLALRPILEEVTHGGSGAVLLDRGRDDDPTILSYAPLVLAGNRFSLVRTAPGTGLAAVSLGALRNTALLACALTGGFFLLFGLHRSSRHTEQLTRDLADRKRRIEQLEQAQETAALRAEQLLHFAGDAMFFLDPDQGRIVAQNHALCELLGYSAEELAGLDLDRLFPGHQKRRYQRLVKTIRKHGYGEEGELTFRRRDGSNFIGAVHARLGVLEQRQVVHGTIRDVTRIKQIESELRRKNRNLELLNRIAHEAASSHDQQGLLNGLLETVTETLEADGGGVFLIRHAGNSLHLAATRGVPDTVAAELAHLRPGKGMIGLVASSGQPRSSANLANDRRRNCSSVLKDSWRGFLAVPIATGKQTLGVLFIYNRKERVFTREETHLLVAIGRQIGTAVEGAELLDALRWQNRLTEASNRELEASRQHLKDNLHRQQETTRALQRLERMKNNFLALASHELRTPLTYILSGAELLLETEAGGNPQQRQLLETVHSGGRRLQEIVSDLLEVARLEAQGIYLGREKIDLTQLIADLGAQLDAQFVEHQQQLTIDLLPEVELYGDPDHLQRALRRVLENAIKFTPPGGLIDISARRVTTGELQQRREELKAFTTSFFDREIDHDCLQLTVSDTGLGIDPEEQVRIFDKFYEVGDITHHHTSRTGFGGKGVGLGLTLVRGMVEAHGGMIWVESEGTADGGKGSRFHIVLPLEKEADETLVSNV